MIFSKKKNIVIFIAAFALLVFLYGIGVLKPVENLLTRILNPVLKQFYIIGTDIKNIYEEQTSKYDLTKVVNELREEVMALSGENAKLKTVVRENDILREHLGFLERNELKYVMSNVISKEDILNVGGQTEVIIIDKGEQNGIRRGLSAVNSQGVIIGKVAEAKERVAKIYLASSDKCKLAVTILGDDDTSGIAQGSLGLVIKMDFIPQIKNLNINDIVVSSGLEKDIPRGLVVGKISEVRKESNKLWQSAIIEPMLDMDELIIVSVIIP
ncbi:rod shape-determining protein MreC [Candidatus Parcubacteria bacterium]|nr:rod shape-determining protein MreC [Candidatus Parcubacteria bacterium]